MKSIIMAYPVPHAPMVQPIIFHFMLLVFIPFDRCGERRKKDLPQTHVFTFSFYPRQSEVSDGTTLSKSEERKEYKQLSIFAQRFYFLLHWKGGGRPPVGSCLHHFFCLFRDVYTVQCAAALLCSALSFSCSKVLYLCMIGIRISILFPFSSFLLNSRVVDSLPVPFLIMTNYTIIQFKSANLLIGGRTQHTGDISSSSFQCAPKGLSLQLNTKLTFQFHHPPS